MFPHQTLLHLETNEPSVERKSSDKKLRPISRISSLLGMNSLSVIRRTWLQKCLSKNNNNQFSNSKGLAKMVLSINTTAFRLYPSSNSMLSVFMKYVRIDQNIIRLPLLLVKMVNKKARYNVTSVHLCQPIRIQYSQSWWKPLKAPSDKIISTVGNLTETIRLFSTRLQWDECFPTKELFRWKCQLYLVSECKC